MRSSLVSVAVFLLVSLTSASTVIKEVNLTGPAMLAFTTTGGIVVAVDSDSDGYTDHYWVVGLLSNQDKIPGPIAIANSTIAYRVERTSDGSRVQSFSLEDPSTNTLIRRDSSQTNDVLRHDGSDRMFSPTWEMSHVYVEPDRVQVQIAGLKQLEPQTFHQYLIAGTTATMDEILARLGVTFPEVATGSYVDPDLLFAKVQPHEYTTFGPLQDFVTEMNDTLADAIQSPPSYGQDEEDCRLRHDCDCTAGGWGSQSCQKTCVFMMECSVTCSPDFGFACCYCNFGMVPVCRCRVRHNAGGGQGGALDGPLHDAPSPWDLDDPGWPE